MSYIICRCALDGLAESIRVDQQVDEAARALAAERHSGTVRKTIVLREVLANAPSVALRLRLRLRMVVHVCVVCVVRGGLRGP